MRQINRQTGTTFVLVTHDEEVASRCDRIIRMRDGVVLDRESEDAGRAVERAA